MALKQVRLNRDVFLSHFSEPANSLASMRVSIHFRTLLLTAGLSLLTGCASNGWKSEVIPYPRSTPFDRDQFTRRAFLDGFERGNRAEMSGGPVSVESLSGPYLDAQKQGFYTGAAEARAKKAETRPHTTK
jgi:hypothetical protein